MARKSRRFSRNYMGGRYTSLRGLGSFGGVGSMVRKALPLALGAAAVYFVFIKPKGRTLTAGAAKPLTPAGRVPDNVETVARLPSTPAGAVPGQLTPAGRSADIVARIRAGVPVNG